MLQPEVEVAVTSVRAVGVKKSAASFLQRLIFLRLFLHHVTQLSVTLLDRSVKTDDDDAYILNQSRLSATC